MICVCCAEVCVCVCVFKNNYSRVICCTVTIHQNKSRGNGGKKIQTLQFRAHINVWRTKILFNLVHHIIIINLKVMILNKIGKCGAHLYVGLFGQPKHVWSSRDNFFMFTFKQPKCYQQRLPSIKNKHLHGPTPSHYVPLFKDHKQSNYSNKLNSWYKALK